jgi:uncharacterized membrane protein YeiB
MTANTASPARSAAPPRDTAVDALRGFALFGIILVNVPFFAQRRRIQLKCRSSHKRRK